MQGTRENVDAIAERLLAVLPTTLPRALALDFFTDPNLPSARWSLNNRLIMRALGNTADARGFRQWQEVGRHVRAGEKAFHIFSPVTRKARAEDADPDAEEASVLLGYRLTPVFAIEQTDGQPLPYQVKQQRTLDELPFRELADRWGLDVGAEVLPAVPRRGVAGYFAPTRRAIRLHVSNSVVWLHELVHAADYRLNREQFATEGYNYNAGEIVAEFGAACLLELLGRATPEDLGAAVSYVTGYATREGLTLMTAIRRFLDRTRQVLALILDEAQAAEVEVAA